MENIEFSKILGRGLPGVENDATPRGSIFKLFRGSQLPYGDFSLLCFYIISPSLLSADAGFYVISEPSLSAYWPPAGNLILPGPLGCSGTIGATGVFLKTRWDSTGI